MKINHDGLNKAINEYEEHGISVELTEREKEMIEYGYTQALLHKGYEEMVNYEENESCTGCKHLFIPDGEPPCDICRRAREDCYMEEVSNE